MCSIWLAQFCPLHSLPSPPTSLQSSPPLLSFPKSLVLKEGNTEEASYPPPGSIPTYEIALVTQYEFSTCCEMKRKMCLFRRELQRRSPLCQARRARAASATRPVPTATAATAAATALRLLRPPVLAGVAAEAEAPEAEGKILHRHPQVRNSRQRFFLRKLVNFRLHRFSIRPRHLNVTTGDNVTLPCPIQGRRNRKE